MDGKEIVYTQDDLKYTFHPVPSLRLSLSVKAPHDAHICLGHDPRGDGPYFIEIFLGGWGNSRSAIRIGREKPEVAQVESPGLLSEDEFRNFVLEWGPDEGTLRVYLAGAPEPLLSWKSPRGLQFIDHIGVRTTEGAKGEWVINGRDELFTEDSMEYIFSKVKVFGGSFDFGVKARNDAHLCLTSSPTESLPIYEVILGGWKNTKGVIRLNKVIEVPELSEFDCPGIINLEEFKFFWIEWDHNGIRVGHHGEVIPFLQLSNPNPHSITHFGIRTGFGSDGYWLLPGQDSSSVRVLSELRDHEKEVHELSKSNYSYSWVKSSGGDVPHGGVVGGKDVNGEELYVARAEHQGAIIPGKLVQSHGVTYVPFDHGELRKETYEVLVALEHGVKWVPGRGGEIPEDAVQGGHSEGGETLFIGRVSHERTLTPGKVHPSLELLFIPFGGSEIAYSEYEILVRG